MKARRKNNTQPAPCPPIPEQISMDGKVAYEGENYDRMIHAQMGAWAGWLSPATAVIAYFDWLSHLSISPAKQMDVFNKTFQNVSRFFFYALESLHGKPCKPCIQLRETDRRFRSELWGETPFNFYAQSFLLYETFWDDMTKGIRGVSKHHEGLVNFMVRQLLDMVAPSNFPLTNPEVLKVSSEKGGMNFINGFDNWLEDVVRYLNKQPPVGTEQFQVGENVAITPGKVVYRNHLIELIQYEPKTKKTYAEPILIVPAWIMKYYILDLSSQNSMVKYLVNKGHTVFMISWRNPTWEDRDLGLEDYIHLGVMNALNTVQHIVPDQKIHAVGYCIGGTLLMMAAAEMGKKRDDRLKTITLFAAEIDFEEAGELQLFIDESQVTYIEDIMWGKGYLDGSQMAGAFSMLRSVDMVWSRMVHDYLLGERRPINDLVAWDYDTTRLPYRMHTEYLRRFFLQNDLVQGAIRLDGKNISLLDINVPIFAVATVKDHVAPWKSVYKLHFYMKSEITFVLTSGGHNSGIVNAPGRPDQHFQMLLHKKEDRRMAPEEWLEKAPGYVGSWWPTWHEWLAAESIGKVVPPNMGNPEAGYTILCDAPGTYVFQR